MGIILRGMRNVLRNPVRLVLVVVLLGASLMFVAAMVSLNNSAQDQLANVHKQVGTAITINYAENNAGQFGGGSNGDAGSGTPTAGGTSGGSASGGGANGGTATPGTGRGFGQFTTTPIPSSVVTQVTGVAGVASAEESLRQSDADGILKTSSIKTPNGQTFSIPPTVYGVSNGATHITLGGSTPTIVDGRGFQDSDANTDVAMLNKSLADLNSLKVGSTFQLKGTTISVIGLYTTSDQFSASTISLPLATVQHLYSVDGVSSITAYAASYEQVQTVAAKLKSALGSTYDVVTQDSLYASTFDGLNVAQNSISLALIVAIVVAIIVIVFAVFIIVRERSVEIGTMKAIGASHWQVISQFWGEVLAMSVLAAIIAVALLAVLGPIISQKFDVSTAATSSTTTSGGPGGRFGGGFAGGRGLFAQSARVNDVHLAAATINTQTLLIIVGLGIALAVLTSVIPAWYVARIKPAVVLRGN